MGKYVGNFCMVFVGSVWFSNIEGDVENKWLTFMQNEIQKQSRTN